MDLKELSKVVQDGSAKKTKELVKKALEENVKPADILNNGLIAAMGEIGDMFTRGEIYVPEMLISAKAMQAGLKVLAPALKEDGVEPIGKAVIGTVKGDLHDIGKNLVKMMMDGAGIEMYDLGVDVSEEAFMQKAEEVGADLICLSALLTTTMTAIDTTIEAFEKKGIKDKYVFMIGGAPVSEEYAQKVHADYYTTDAASAAAVAKEVLAKRRAEKA